MTNSVSDSPLNPKRAVKAKRLREMKAMEGGVAEGRVRRRGVDRDKRGRSE